MEHQEYKTENQYNYVLITILILALIFRLIDINRSFSNDELSAISRTIYTNFNDLIVFGVITDNHPILTQVWLWFWVKLFPISEISIRLPFIIFSLVSIYFVYKTFLIWANKNIALCIAALMAISSYFIEYSWLARPYGMGFLWCVLAYYFGTKTVKNEQKINWFFYALFNILALYTHYFSFLSVLVFGGVLFLFYPKIRIKLLLVALICIVLFIPHFYITNIQFSRGGIGGWLGKPDNGFLFEYLFFIFNKSWAFVMLFVTAYLIIIFKEKLWKRFSYNTIYNFFYIGLLTFFIVFFTGFFYSKFINAVLQFSVLIFCSSFLLFIIFYPLKNASKKSTTILLFIIVIGGSVSLVYPKSYYGINRFGVFKEIGQQASKDIKKYNADIVFNSNNPYYFRYYSKDIDTNICTNIFFNNAYTLTNFENKIKTFRKPYLVYAWSNANNPPAILSIIQTYFPYPVHHFYWHNSEYYLFSKDSILEEKDFYKKENIQLDTNLTNAEYAGILETSQNTLKIKPFSYLVMNVTLDSMDDFDKENTLLVLERNDKKTSQNIQYISQKFELKNGEYVAKLGVQIDKRNSGDIELKYYIWNKNKTQLKPISANLERWKENEILY